MPAIGRPIMAHKINWEVSIMYQKSSGFLRQEKVLVLLVIVAFILAAFWAIGGGRRKTD